jgi:hypothetical protein
MPTVRKLMLAYFIWLLLEGAVRKWLLPEYASQIFVVKDLLLWGMFLYALDDLAAEPHTQTGFQVVALASVFFFGLFLLTPVSLVSAIGLRYYLSGLPLVVLVPYLLEDLDDLEQVGQRILLVTVPLLLLAVVQYGSAPDAEINRYVGSETTPEVAVFGVESTETNAAAPNRARVTSTFSYISPYGAYLQTVSVLVWALLLVSRSRLWAVGAMVAFVLASMAFTGARGAVGFGVVVSVLFLLYGMGTGALGRILGGIAAGGVLLLCMTPFYLGEAVDMFMARSLQSEDFLERLVAFALAPLTTLVDADLAGAGMGSTFAGAAEIAGTSQDSLATYSEADHDRVGIELGTVAYAMIILFKLGFLGLTLRLVASAADPKVRVWALGAFVVQIISGLVIPFHNTIANASYMAALGLCLWLREWSLAHAGAVAEEEGEA